MYIKSTYVPILKLDYYSYKFAFIILYFYYIYKLSLLINI